MGDVAAWLQRLVAFIAHGTSAVGFWGFVVKRFVHRIDILRTTRIQQRDSQDGKEEQKLFHD